jgi:hypothetical protein
MAPKILICGLLYSGSSAILDALSSHPEVKEVPGEFDDFRRDGMIGDLVEHGSDSGTVMGLARYVLFNGDPIMKLALLRDYHNADRLETMFWRFVGFLRLAASIIKRPRSLAEIRRRKKRLRLLARLPINHFSPSSPLEARIGAAREWMSDVTSVHGDSKRALMLDQPLMLGNHSSSWPEVFSPYKLIVVVRHPLDQITELIEKGVIDFEFRSSITGSLPLIHGSDQSSKIMYAAKALEVRLEWVLSHLIKNDLEMQVIVFEDFILDFENQMVELLKFLNLTWTGWASTSEGRFDPKVSEKNTGLNHKWLDLLPPGSLDSLMRTWGNVISQIKATTGEDPR